MSKHDYDLICIGSGSAGGGAAYVAKRAGKKVAIVEARRDQLGGHCPNYACVPTKALLRAAQVYKLVQKASEYGIKAENPGFDFAEVAKYRDDIVGQLTGPRIERNLDKAGIDLLWGHAKFVSEHELEIDGKKYSAENIVIGTGSKEFVPPIEGLEETGFWVSDDAVKLTKLPKSIIIIGAGPVGTEFSQMFSSFGVDVTLLQRNDQILQREDKEIATYVQDDLKERGANIVTSMDVVSVSKQGDKKIVKVKVGDKEMEHSAEEVMIATGRRAHLQDLNLEAAGLKLDDRGKLPLNEYLQTEQAHIWAAGDAAANWQFTHTATYEGDLVGRNICFGHDEAVNYDVIPRVTFCEPEVASVGMTQEETEAKSMKIEVAKFPIGSLGRALINHDRRGFVKIIADAESKQIVGGHVVGEEAGQLIHEIAVCMKAQVPATVIGKTIHAYPTFSEAVAAAAEKFLTD